ncbi:hypothetical protein [Bradyrhizobium sp. CCBAU 53338]|uniref:hypothetical protein n=1 Tax=Bradyrhizobium sp. CCBAU 53338 TaxID=1325111 RepID=UPI00188A1B90|nr:hypothetical protein [Bradyrhizobium sp. CCBAU 53338]
MPKRDKEALHCLVTATAKGIRIQLPKTDDLSPLYSRKQVKNIIADLQSALDNDLFLA